MDSSGTRPWLVNIAIFLSSLLLSLAAAELLFRLPVFGSECRLKNFAAKDDPRLTTLDENYHVFRPSAILGYEHIPNSTPAGRGAIIAPPINSYGMVGKEYELGKGKDTYRILLLGDSIAEFNWYAESLEEKLNSDARLRHNFEIWNAGVCGYEVNQYLNYLRYKGIKYHPDMVIIGLCLNDFGGHSIPVFYKDSKGFTEYHYPAPYLGRIMPLNRFLFKHSYLYRFLIIRLETLLARRYQEGEWDNVRIGTGLDSLGKIKRICLDKNIPLVCVIFPYLKPLIKYTSVERGDYDSMIRVLKELDIDYLDLHSYFPEAKRYELRNSIKDHIHPSREGHEIAAREMHKHLSDYLIRAIEKI